MNPLVLDGLTRTVIRNWKALLIVVPAMVLVAVLLPGWVAALIFILAFAAAVWFLVGGFVRNVRRGWTGRD
jgi:hypothetical protein